MLAADTSTQRYDIICLSEIYLDSSVPGDTDGLPPKGFYLVQADHPGNMIRGSVCIYLKEDLSLLALHVSFFPECLLCEFTIKGERDYVPITYHYYSQSNLEFSNYLSIFNKLIEQWKRLKFPLQLLLEISMLDLNYAGQMISIRPMQLESIFT